MNSNQILITILVIISADYLLEQLLSYFNIKSNKSEIPDSMKEYYDKEKYAKSQEYLKVQTRFSYLTSGLSFVIAFILLFFGLFGWLDQMINTYFDNPILLALAFFGILFLASDLLGTPFSWYSIFIIEERFGFNKTTPKLFFVDKVKGYLLTIIIGGGILALLLYLIQVMGPNFWLVFWIAISAFILFINMFYTSLIVPLFNKLTPLQDGELMDSIKVYSEKVKFPLTKVFVIDGSKRSKKANAFFSGIGKKKKVVLYDTLIENHTINELVAVLAHEIGHYKKKHITIGFILSVLQVGVTLFIMSLMIFNTDLSMALGADHLAIHLNLIAFAILFSPVSKITGIFMNIFSRKNEFEADAFAANTFEGESLATALKKLSVDNLSNLYPHPWYVFFHYSHPPLMLRLKALETKS